MIADVQVFEMNWLSIALTPFDLKHIEYYLRFAVIPVTVTGVYLGVVADWTAGFYPVDGFNYHVLERQILFFVAYSYFLLNWAAYVARYVGKYDGPRALVSPFIITMGVLVCVFLSGIDQLEPWGSLFTNFGEYGEYSFIY
ncbi:hypothetical protein E1160_06795, partial [Rhodospirillaceae bacterium RKSG073]|nr:hypothetical protein [Curvivirga aplysinae]